MKLYPKKSASLEDETILVQIERRHTLKEGTSEAESDDLRKTTRTNSLSSFGEGPSSTDDIQAVAAESSLTRRPTVITESELSSSWLYKDRKAKINSDDESIEDPRPTMPHEDHEDLQPKTLNDPKLRPTHVSNQRPRKMSSCCWYFTIILVICIACLSVMAGVGGIVYMEYFAVYKDKNNANTNASVENDSPTAPKEIFHHPTFKQDNFHRNEPRIPEHILKKIIKNSTMRAEDTNVSRKTVASSQPNEDIFHNKDLTDSNKSKAKELNKMISSFDSVNQEIEITDQPKAAEHSDASINIHDRINHFILPITDKSVEKESNVENQDSLALKLNYQSIGDVMDKIPNEHVNNANEQMLGDGNIAAEKSNSKAEILDSSNEVLVSGGSFNSNEVTTLQDIELKGELSNADIMFDHLPELNLLPDDNSFKQIENSIDDNQEDSFFDHRKLTSGHDLKDNSFDHNEHSIDSDKSLNDHNEDSRDIDSNDSSSEEHSLADDQNQNSDDSAQLVFIRPAVESKAVPVPLAFLRRIGFDIQNPNSHQPMTAKDMDIKFSLPEAMQYLRSLDPESKLPISGEKTVTPETNDIKNSNGHQPMTATEMDIKFSLPEALQYLRSLDPESKLSVSGEKTVTPKTNDIKNSNGHQPMTATEMDIKFSLAEALKLLRSLDTESKLPVSREKIVPRNQEESKKTKVPITSEREEYLNRLRKQIFEKSL